MPRVENLLIPQLQRLHLQLFSTLYNMMSREHPESRTGRKLWSSSLHHPCPIKATKHNDGAQPPTAQCSHSCHLQHTVAATTTRLTVETVSVLRPSGSYSKSLTGTPTDLHYGCTICTVKSICKYNNISTLCEDPSLPLLQANVHTLSTL